MTSAGTASSGACCSGVRSRSGWYSGTPRPVASRFTGPGVRCWPRPAARSGCVRTRGTAWPAARMASSARAANSGVPAKMTRIVLTVYCKATAVAICAALFNRLLTDQTLSLFCFVFQALLLERRQILDEHLAYQMVHFMLDTDGEQ